jgi:hypothetical protein
MTCVELVMGWEISKNMGARVILNCNHPYLAGPCSKGLIVKF